MGITWRAARLKAGLAICFWLIAWPASEQLGRAPASPADAVPDPDLLPGTLFRDRTAAGDDCPFCPSMIAVPAGDFLMGSPSDEPGRHGNEGPQHTVRLARSFALGVHEVTFDQWDACVRAGGCLDAAADEGWGRGDRPVINVAWSDAQDYVRWLSALTGQTYRLPSEAEWEYAARAGTTTAYYWGDRQGSGHAVCERCGSEWDNRGTAPTGSFPPNPFGLHDMAGNAWEWTEDCWNPDYTGAPADGSPWLAGDCDGRVMRGGAWFSFPRNIRSAIRMRGVIDNRYLSKGFRVVRVL